MPMIRVKVSMLGHVESLEDPPVLLVEIRQFLDLSASRMMSGAL